MHSEARAKRTRRTNKANSAKPKVIAGNVGAVVPANLPVAVESPTLNCVHPIPSVALQRDQRVGEVRIGKVMMQLLKRYGITDEEIASVLASIAQENCSTRAS